jgi:hypothetical protein
LARNLSSKREWPRRQNRVEHVIDWQAVLIFLIGAQLGTRRAGDDALDGLMKSVIAP